MSKNNGTYRGLKGVKVRVLGPQQVLVIMDHDDENPPIVAIILMPEGRKPEDLFKIWMTRRSSVALSQHCHLFSQLSRRSSSTAAMLFASSFS